MNALEGRSGLARASRPRLRVLARKLGQKMRRHRLALPVLLPLQPVEPVVPASKVDDAIVTAEPSCSPSLHLVPLDEEVAHAVADMVVDGPIGRQSGSVAEVR